MSLEKVDGFQINNNAKVKVIKQGNITEIRHMTFRNDEAQIRKIDDDTYEVLKTGEIKPFNHWENRGDGQTVCVRHLIIYVVGRQIVAGESCKLKSVIVPAVFCVAGGCCLLYQAIPGFIVALFQPDSCRSG